MSSKIIIKFEEDTYAEEYIEYVRQLLMIMVKRDSRLEKARVTVKSEVSDELITENANEWVLDLHEAGHWLARYNDDTYPIGRNEANAKLIVEKLNKMHRPNLEFRDGSLFICDNDHPKGAPCEYRIFVDKAI